MIRTVAVVLFLTIYILLAGPLFILHCLLTRSPERLYRVGVAGARWALRLGGVRTLARGLGNIPAGPCIFVANHISNIDPPAVVVALPRRVALLAKKEVFRIPLLARALLLAQMIPVDRSDPSAAKASVEQALVNLKAGVSYLIFPEGTRSPDGRLRPFKKGSFVMAIRAGVPIVPVSVSGAHHLMRKGSLALRPGDVGVHFGQPIATASFTLEQRDDLIRLVEQAVARNLPPEQQPLPSNGSPA